MLLFRAPPDQDLAQKGSKKGSKMDHFGVKKGSKMTIFGPFLTPFFEGPVKKGSIYTDVL